MVAFDYKKTPITQIADYIIMYSSKSGASDIHFDPRDNGLMVRIRIDGDLQDYTLIPPDYERNLTTRLKLLANMNITESRLPQDGAIKGTYGDQYLDMRVSCLPTNEGEKIVIRILDYSRSLEGLEHLGFSKINFLKLQRMIQVPNGIILVTGATGTGKSTTTYSILQALNKPEKNIITVEDPVEMNIEGLNQVQVNSEIGLDFATVLRSILRQDPNIILIGEIRDSETAKIAVRASITGHLVLSTIHTNNSLATIERLLDMDVERYLLSSALTGIISQRLAKKLCPKCREKKEASKYEKKVFQKVLGEEVSELYVAHEGGCNECHKGYKGRIAIQEVLEIDDQIKNALNNEKITKEEMQYMVYTSNVITLLQDGLMKVLEGITSFDEIYRIIEIDSDIADSTSAELAQMEEENQAVIQNEKEAIKTRKSTNSEVGSNVKSFLVDKKNIENKETPTQKKEETATLLNDNKEEEQATLLDTPAEKKDTATLIESNNNEKEETATLVDNKESTATLMPPNNASEATLIDTSKEEQSQPELVGSTQASLFNPSIDKEKGEAILLSTPTTDEAKSENISLPILNT